MAISSVELPLSEAICLALIADEPRHGWSIVKELSPEGELGGIWTLSRPLTYRALDQLETKRLITRKDATAVAASSSPGRHRVMFSATAAGKRHAARWLAEPVTHLRDIRTEFLLKATLLSRCDGDVLGLLTATEAALAPRLDQLGNERGESSAVDHWRRESARAAQRFFLRMRSDLTGRSDAEDLRPLRLSARNQLRATVEAIHDGEVLSTVKVLLPDGQRVTATITKDATRELDLTSGDAVLVIVKSTEVMIAK